MINLTALRPTPVAVFNDLLNEYPDLSDPAPFIKPVSQFQQLTQSSQIKTLGIFGGTVPDKTLLDYVQTPVASVFNQFPAAWSSKVRLVAGGARVFKTSQAISEQGTVRMVYKPRGGAPQTNLDRCFETGPTSKNSVKIFPS